MELILILALLVGFYMAWNIGANDVANAMGTSVGSGALTLKGAVVVAAVLEFGGAFLMGSHVSETLKGKYFFVEQLGPSLDLLAIGMLSALLAAGLWLQLATFLGLPVSTTHSIVGAVVGFALVQGGISAVNWPSVGMTVAAWVLSPLLGGLSAAVVFTLIKRRIINAADPLAAVRRYSPVLVFAVFFVLSLVTLWKGLKNLKLELTSAESLLLAIAIASAAALVGFLLIGRLTDNQRLEMSEGVSMDPQFAFVERVFAYLQILSACAVAFAHGANDVANSVGPLAAVHSIVTSGELQVAAPVPLFILALGGIGIVIGLATWGYRVIKTIGEKITELTPTRGFAAEFGASCTIVVASRMGIPISTTHTLVGAVVGIGLSRGVASLNTRVFRDILVSWAVTVPLAGGLAALLFTGLKAIL